jgi:hypothetical protein
MWAAAAVDQIEKDLPSGAKAHIHLALFMYGLKPVTFKMPAVLCGGDLTS